MTSQLPASPPYDSFNPIIKKKMPFANNFGDAFSSSMGSVRSSATSSPASTSSSVSSNKSLAVETDSDVFNLAPTSALILLARSVELLVSLGGDAAPPTPPSSAPSTPELLATTGGYPGTASPMPSPPSGSLSSVGFGMEMDTEMDGVFLKQKQSPEEKIIGQCNNQAQQMDAITKRFWAKTAAKISIEDYLFRIHRYCPMSTAVYLAAACYIHRIAIVDKTMPVTRLNVHRLLLAALRVANKSLEDIIYSHTALAKVGGLRQTELARLEIGFCFLLDFDLRVDEAEMERQVMILRDTVQHQANLGTSGILRPGASSPIKIPKERKATVYMDV